MFLAVLFILLVANNAVAEKRHLPTFPYQTDQLKIIYNEFEYDNHFCELEGFIHNATVAIVHQPHGKHLTGGYGCRFRYIKPEGHCSYSYRRGCVYEPPYKRFHTGPFIPVRPTPTTSTTPRPQLPLPCESRVQLNDHVRAFLRYPMTWMGKTIYNTAMFDGYHCPYNATYSEEHGGFQLFCLSNESAHNWPGRCAQICETLQPGNVTTSHIGCQFITDATPYEPDLAEYDDP
jgi:hypothetical protein